LIPVGAAEAAMLRQESHRGFCRSYDSGKQKLAAQAAPTGVDAHAEQSQWNNQAFQVIFL
jgi:hypothetical protein